MIAKLFVLWAVIGLMSCAPPSHVLDVLAGGKAIEGEEDGSLPPTAQKLPRTIQRRDSHEHPLDNIKPINEKLDGTRAEGVLHKVPLTKDTKDNNPHLAHDNVGL